MRLPFFGSGKGNEPIRLSLPGSLQVSFAVYFKSLRDAPPEPAALKPVMAAWLARHAREPLRSAVRDWVERGFLMLEVGPKEMLRLPPLELLQMWRPGELEERRFLEADHAVLVGTEDLLLPPRIGLWAATAGARALAEAAGGVILDPEFPRLLTIQPHQEDLPPAGRIHAAEHIMVPSSTDRRGLSWITTKGMGRFGLPELEIRDAPRNLTGSLSQLLNAVAQHLVTTALRQAQERGEPLSELEVGPEIRLEAAEIARAYGSDEPVDTEGARGWTLVRLEYHPGRKGEDSFLRLVPPQGARRDHGVWLNSLLTDLFGVEDTLRTVKSDSEAMEAAHLQAVSELPLVKQRFQAGLQPEETLIVKHGFPTGDDHHEFMWLVVSTWKGDRIEAQLANDPQVRLDLRAGQTVELRDADVFDWAIMHADGRSEGGYTNRVVERESE
jgi:uncharacterized protein YegJ (DUF2314 family)